MLPLESRFFIMSKCIMFPHSICTVYSTLFELTATFDLSCVNSEFTIKLP